MSVSHHIVVLFIGQFIIGLSRNWINVTVDSLLMINMPLAMLIFGGLMDALGVYNIF